MTLIKSLPGDFPALPRLFGWLVLAVLLLAAVWLLAPQQLPVSLYKLSLVCVAAVVGYRLDRGLFPYARPDKFLTWASTEPVWAVPFAAAMLRRALVVSAAMLAMGLGA